MWEEHLRNNFRDARESGRWHDFASLLVVVACFNGFWEDGHIVILHRRRSGGHFFMEKRNRGVERGKENKSRSAETPPGGKIKNRDVCL